MAEDSWFDSRQGVILISKIRQDWLWGPPNVLSDEYRGIKPLWRDAYSSPPCTAEVKGAGSHILTPQYAFIASTETFFTFQEFNKGSWFVELRTIRFDTNITCKFGRPKLPYILPVAFSSSCSRSTWLNLQSFLSCFLSFFLSSYSSFPTSGIRPSPSNYWNRTCEIGVI